jgi:hypothetical protein
MDEITHAYYQGVQDYFDSANAMAAYNVSPEMIAYYQGMADYNDAINAAAEAANPEIADYYNELSQYFQGLADYQAAVEDAVQQEAQYQAVLEAAAQQEAAQQSITADAYMQGWQDCSNHIAMSNAEMARISQEAAGGL